MQLLQRAMKALWFQINKISETFLLGENFAKVYFLRGDRLKPLCQ